MRETFLPVLVAAAGLAAGPALPAYAGWIVRCRRGELARETGQHWMAASLANAAGWLLAWAICPQPAEAAELGLTVSAAVALTIIDIRIRIIPNELVAALLCLWFAFALMEKGVAALPGRAGGFLTALAVFLLAALPGKGKKAGGGDVKLAAAAGFAAGFPGVLAAVLLAGLAALLTGGARILLGRIGRKTPMPFAGFIMAGLIAAMALDRAGALRLPGWN